MRVRVYRLTPPATNTDRPSDRVLGTIEGELMRFLRIVYREDRRVMARELIGETPLERFLDGVGRGRPLCLRLDDGFFWHSSAVRNLVLSSAVPEEEVEVQTQSGSVYRVLWMDRPLPEVYPHPPTRENP